MGMAASQARFLGLTARKTNVEYQGQQVNQARTVLANESAGLFNEMMVLKVPTPPVVNDYYNSRYQFESATMNNYSIKTMESIDGSKTDFNITMDYMKNVLTGYVKSGSNITMTEDASTTPSTWKVGEFTLKEATEQADLDNIAALKANAALGIDPDQKFMKYVDNTIATSPATYYVLDPKVVTDPPTTTSPRYYAADKKTPAVATAKAVFTAEDSGRFTSVTLSDVEPIDAKNDIKEGVPYDLTLSKTYDQDAYDQASLDYNFAKMQYENEIQRINAQTEKLQMEDRQLELKLRQLDTEQKALQTEMESVQKVIQKNVEVTFKTFA